MTPPLQFTVFGQPQEVLAGWCKRGKSLEFNHFLLNYQKRGMSKQHEDAKASFTLDIRRANNVIII